MCNGDNIMSADMIDALSVKIVNLFSDAKRETFENGMDSMFAIKLQRIILYYGNVSVIALKYALSSEKADIEIIEESLIQVGNMTDDATHDRRLEFLAHMLKSPHVRVRYAAMVGLESLDDPIVIPDIRDAIASEKSKMLKTNLKLTLKQLKETAHI